MAIVVARRPSAWVEPKVTHARPEHLVPLLLQRPKAREFSQEGQVHLPRRPVAVLAHNDLGDPLLCLLQVCHEDHEGGSNDRLTEVMLHERWEQTPEDALRCVGVRSRLSPFDC
jgi:hypothetical protein